MSERDVPATFDGMRAAFDALDTIWLDGEFTAWEDAQIHVLSHALHYGTGVFEGVRCYDSGDGPAIFRWEDHLDRFYESAKPYGMDIPFDREAVTAATLELIRRQNLRSCYIRPIAFYGYERLGVNPNSPTQIPVSLAVACWPWGTYLGEEAIEEGVDVMVSSWRKHASDQIPTTAKATGPYVNSVLAGEEARRNGYAEAIVLNDGGTVAEGAGENLFLVRDGELYTPGPAESILDGITRQSVVELARDAGYRVHDGATISRGELYTADELFFTGTAAEVTPIRSVDGTDIGTDRKGPVTDEIQTLFFDLVEGDLDGYEEWFTPIPDQQTPHRA